MDIFDLANPEFIGSMSSNELWYGDETNIRLTDVIEHKSDYDHTHSGYASQSDLASKANATHTHLEYAPSSHTHSEYAATNHTHNNYAETAHTHTDYANSVHTHSASSIGAIANTDIATVSEVETYLGI